MNDAQDFLSLFVALLAVMNALPILPIFAGAVVDVPAAHRGRVIDAAVLTGLAVGVVVILIGPELLALLGVTLNDLRIGGGLVLLVFAIYDLLFSRKHRKQSAADPEEIGPVPLGVPLLVGPAGLTAALVLAEEHGPWLTLAVFGGHVAVNWALLRGVIPWLLRGGSVTWVRAVGHVFALVLTAIAAAMIRTGVEGAVAAA